MWEQSKVAVKERISDMRLFVAIDGCVSLVVSPFGDCHGLTRGLQWLTKTLCDQRPRIATDGPEQWRPVRVGLVC